MSGHEKIRKHRISESLPQFSNHKVSPTQFPRIGHGYSHLYKLYSSQFHYSAALLLRAPGLRHATSSTSDAFFCSSHLDKHLVILDSVPGLTGKNLFSPIFVVRSQEDLCCHQGASSSAALTPTACLFLSVSGVSWYSAPYFTSFTLFYLVFFFFHYYFSSCGAGDCTYITVFLGECSVLS